MVYLFILFLIPFFHSLDGFVSSLYCRIIDCQGRDSKFFYCRLNVMVLGLVSHSWYTLIHLIQYVIHASNGAFYLADWLLFPWFLFVSLSECQFPCRILPLCCCISSWFCWFLNNLDSKLISLLHFETCFCPL